MILHNKIIRIISLVMVVPIIIGHGLGGNLSDLLSTPKPYCKDLVNVGECKDFTISGSMNINADIQVPDKLYISVENHLSDKIGNSINVLGTTNTTVPALEFDTLEDISNIRIKTNISGSTKNIGELWIHNRGFTSRIINDSKDKPLKLHHSSLITSVINYEFSFDNTDFELPQSSTIASSSVYTLSSGSTGSEWLSFYSPTKIIANGVTIFEKTNYGEQFIMPITFSENVNMILRIEMLNGKSSSIWIHAPSGKGTKLLQRGLSSNVKINYSLTN